LNNQLHITIEIDALLYLCHRVSGASYQQLILYVHLIAFQPAFGINTGGNNYIGFYSETKETL